jgi:hypothetical protein
MMKKIKFIEDCEVEAQGQVLQSFKAGQVVELSHASARRWIRRNKAVEVQGGAAKPAATKSAAKKRAPKKAAAKKRKPANTAGAPE